MKHSNAVVRYGSMFNLLALLCEQQAEVAFVCQLSQCEVRNVAMGVRNVLLTSLPREVNAIVPINLAKDRCDDTVCLCISISVYHAGGIPVEQLLNSKTIARM
jgi:hypothetical protein